MALTQSEIENAIAAIDARLNNAVTRVTTGDKTVERDLSALRVRRGELQAELTKLTGATPIVRHIRTYSEKGL